MKHLLISNHSE